MKKFSDKSSGLFRTIFISSMGCMLFPVLIVSFISIRTFSGNLENTAKSNLNQISIEKMNEVSAMIQDQISLTKSVAETDYIQEDMAFSRDSKRVMQYLGTVGQNANGLYENFFITHNSAGYADCLGNATLHDVTGEPWYEECLKNGQFMGNNISPVTGRPVYVISYAVKYNGRTIGGLNNSIDLAAMTEKITGTIADDKTKVLIIDDGGNVIASGNSDQILKTNFNSENESTKKLMQEILSKKNGISSFFFDGTENIVAYSNVGSMYTLVYMPQSVYKGMTLSVIRKIMLSIAACIIVAIILIILVSASITKPLKVVNDSINDIASGNADLTQRISINAKHEVRSLVEGFNKFSGKMQTLVMEIKSSQEELAKAGESLQNSTYDTESSITEIIANIQSVNERILDQSKSVDKTAETIKAISEKLSGLTEMIGTQGTSVTNATTEVHEMLENITNVNSLIVEMGRGFDALRENISTGSKKQNDVTERVKQIEEQSKMLNEANAVIINIAEQTNLLAMNAAIEAAHAGESGKGFSVVADEIRKLSETSGQQSKRINEELQAISDSISSVVDASRESQESFTQISEKISTTGDSFAKIQVSMEKQASGSNEINRSLGEMTENTKNVLESSKEISEESLSILDEMKMLQNSSFEMKNNISEMQLGAKKINETGENLSEISRQVKESIDKSNAQIGKFKV